MSMPIAQARIVSQTATQNTASPNLATKSAIAAEAGGINRASTIPTIGNSSQTPRNNTTPAKPNNRLAGVVLRSEEHTSELQSRGHLVCRLLLEKQKKI